MPALPELPPKDFLNKDDPMFIQKYVSALYDLFSSWFPSSPLRCLSRSLSLILSLFSLARSLFSVLTLSLSRFLALARFSLFSLSLLALSLSHASSPALLSPA